MDKIHFHFDSTINLYINLIFYILFVLLLQIISANDVYTSFNYLKTFELQNGNILFCTEKGILLKEKITGELNQIDQAILESVITKEDFDFVTISQFEEGEKFIIILYKVNIFIFTHEGEYYTKGNVTIIPDGKYFTLIPYKITTSNSMNEYHFFIGFLDDDGDSKFLISHYSFDNNLKNIINNENEYLFFPGIDNRYTYTIHGFSCEIMKSNEYNEVLTCFFSIANKLSISSYNLNNYSYIEELIIIKEDANPINIHSKISNDKTKSLVCYLKNWNTGECDIYDINNNNLTSITENRGLELACNYNYPSMTIMYNSLNKNDYFFGCAGYSHDIALIRFNSNFEIESYINNNEYIINNEQCYTLSIVKSLNNDNNYNIFASCQGSGVIYKNDLPENIASYERELPKTGEIYNTILEITKKTEIESTNKFERENESKTYIITQTEDISDKISDLASFSQYIINTEKNQIIDSAFIYKNKNGSCSKEYLYQNVETKECLHFCSSEDLLNKKCKLNFVNSSNIGDFTQNIRNIIYQKNMTSDTNIVIEGDNTIYQLISSEKMSDNENTNMSIIDLGDCGKKLLDENHLDYLLILKIDTKLDENTAVILNYEVYNPLNNEKLNLSICNDMKIYTYNNYYPSEESLSKVQQLSQFGYDLYDINNDFYQDICTSFTSENGTDILLSDRKSDFYENVSLCENGCEYKGYDLNKKRVKCECSVKEEIKVEENKNNNNIIENLFGKSKFSNIKLLKCFKLVFSIKGLKNNKGSIILLCSVSSLIILGFIYAINQEMYIVRNIRKINNEKYKEKVFPPKKKKMKLKNNVVIFNYVNNKNNKTNSISSFKMGNNINTKHDIVTEKNEIIKEEEKKYVNYIFTNEELNSLSYELALEHDKRTYFQYYSSLLMQKHLIIFTFCNNKDYNIFVLKFSLLISSFALYFAVNALFFTDETMHNIYEQKGNAGIISQISNIFYSTVISCFINIIIKKLGLSNDDMIKIKQIHNSNEELKQSTQLLKKLKLKFALFFILTFLLNSFFWYFIAAFCAVYKNTQNILIENTFLSFFLSLLYPFGINLIPGIFRIPSLKNYSGCSKYCYFISKLLAII